MKDILLAHGSPDARHGDQVRQLAGQASDLLGHEVRVAFLSDKALPAGSRVLPLFLGIGQHMRLDVPKLVAASNCELLPSLAGQGDRLAGMAMDLVNGEAGRANALFSVYRFFGFEEVVAALYRQASKCAKMALASMHGEPSLVSVLELWRREGVAEVSVQPMLLFDGFTCDKLRIAASRVEGLTIHFGPVLAEHPAMPQLIADCLKEGCQ